MSLNNTRTPNIIGTCIVNLQTNSNTFVNICLPASGDTSYFKIDSSNGAVTTTSTPIVYTTIQTASIVVTATDSGSSPRSSAVAVSITVRKYSSLSKLFICTLL